MKKTNKSKKEKVGQDEYDNILAKQLEGNSLANGRESVF